MIQSSHRNKPERRTQD